MTHRLHHEHIYRGKETMDKLAVAPIHICGAGALGSNLAINLVRTGVGRLTVIDRDRVEEHNIGTQVYSIEDIQGCKADILRNLIYRDVGVEISALNQELTERNVSKLLRGAQLVVDTFDNTAARRAVTDYCKANSLPCLHAGVNNEYGEIIWNENYRVPSDVGIDVCDYPLARNLILLVVAVASEAIIRFLSTQERLNYSITVGDLAINCETDIRIY